MIRIIKNESFINNKRNVRKQKSEVLLHTSNLTIPNSKHQCEDEKVINTRPICVDLVKVTFGSSHLRSSFVQSARIYDAKKYLEDLIIRDNNASKLAQDFNITLDRHISTKNEKGIQKVLKTIKLIQENEEILYNKSFYEMPKNIIKEFAKVFTNNSGYEVISVRSFLKAFPKQDIRNDENRNNYKYIDFGRLLYSFINEKKIDHKPLLVHQKAGIDNILEQVDGLKNLYIGNKKSIFALKTSFDALKINIQALLEDFHFSEEDKKTVLDSLTNTPDGLLFENSPEILNEPLLSQINEQIQQYLSSDNLIIKEQNEAVENSLKAIFQAFPSLITTVGKEQVCHSYTIDTHIIAVAKAIVENENFNNLSTQNQKILLISAILHDISKEEGGNDPTHAAKGAEYAYQMLKTSYLSEEDCKTVANLIYNHHFGEIMSSNDENKIKTLAFECLTSSNSQFMQMLEILIQADLEGNNISKYKSTDIPPKIQDLEIKMQAIKTTLKTLHKQLVFTPFPKDLKYDSKLYGVQVIDLSNNPTKEDLKRIGFKEGTTIENLQFLIHSVATKKNVEGIEYLTSGFFKPNAVLSNSKLLLKKPNYFANNKIGFISDGNTNIIGTSSYASGFHKTRVDIGRLISESDNEEILTTDNQIVAVFYTKEKYMQIKENPNSDEASIALLDFARKKYIPLVILP